MELEPGGPASLDHERNLFSSLLICLKNESPSNNTLRIFMWLSSYDGEVVEEYQKSQATYFIADGPKQVLSLLAAMVAILALITVRHEL